MQILEKPVNFYLNFYSAMQFRLSSRRYRAFISRDTLQLYPIELAAKSSGHVCSKQQLTSLPYSDMKRHTEGEPA